MAILYPFSSNQKSAEDSEKGIGGEGIFGTTVALLHLVLDIVLL
jgi:hypothetical protein